MTALSIRDATVDDRDDIIALLTATHGWADDRRFRDFHEWKHDRGPFGRSPAWVATDDTGVVGYRSFVLWEFEDGDGRVITAARAVDAATSPPAQGRGVFRSLIEHALEQLRAARVDLVFTTPNAPAASVWRRAGARDIGAISIGIRPRSALALPRLLRSRTAADRWPVRVGSGMPAAVLGELPLDGLLSSLPATPGIRTRRTAAFLAWRYGYEPLGYRCVGISDDVAEGLAIFRIRRRGGTIETVIDDLLVPGGHPRLKARLIREVARAAPSTHMTAVGRGLLRHGFVSPPGLGPHVFVLPISSAVDMEDGRHFEWSLGDVELL